MSTLKAAETHLMELRKIHSMLHAVMDALIKDMNANEASRILILLDDRLTSLINSAEIEREPKPQRVTAAEPVVVEPVAAGPVAEPVPAKETAAATPPKSREAAANPQPPAPRAEPPVAPRAEAPPMPVRPAKVEPPVVADKPAASVVAPPPAAADVPDLTTIPETPIMAVPPPAVPPAPAPSAAVPPAPATPAAVPPAAAASGAPEPRPARPAFPSFEDMIASAARAKVSSEAGPKPAGDTKRMESAAPAEKPALPAAATERPASPEPVPAAIRPAPLPPRPVTPPAPVPPAIVGPPPPPVPRPADSAKTTEPEEDWIEEDFEEGEDLAAVPEPQPSERKAGLAGRLLSKLRLPGLKRRPADAEAELEPAPDDEDIYDEVEDDVVDDEDERFDTDEQAEPVPAPGVVDRNLRRLHGVAAQLVDGDLLAEAEKRTGNRIELRAVPAGLDLVVKGLPTALGTVRLSADDGHVVYQPRFGLDLPAREPNRADLELWTKAMGDLVVRVLEDIAERRKGRSETTPAVDEPT